MAFKSLFYDMSCPPKIKSLFIQLPKKKSYAGYLAWLTRSQNGIHSLQDVGINTPPQPNSGWVFKKIHLTFRPLLQCILLLKMEATTGTGLVFTANRTEDV